MLSFLLSDENLPGVCQFVSPSKSFVMLLLSCDFKTREMFFSIEIFGPQYASIVKMPVISLIFFAGV